MKRSAPPEPAGQASKPASRQTPVSCRHCRSKKLKCDRTHPCFNCHTRGLTCEYEAAPLPKSVDSPTASDHLDQVLHRLERLERLLQPTFTYTDGNHETRFAGHLRDNVHADSGPDLLQVNSLRRRISTDDEDLQRLDAIPNDILSAYSCSSALLNQGDIVRAHTSGLAEILLIPRVKQLQDAALPTYHDAQILLQMYIKDIEPVQRLLFMPTVASKMEQLYKQIDSEQQPDPATVALYLGIFALSMGHVATVTTTPFTLTYDECLKCSMYWRLRAIEITSKLKATSSTSFEQLQATLVLTHPGSSMQGISTGWSFLISDGLVLAKELRIHLLDSPAQQRHRHKMSIPQLIELEMMRRAWWQLVSVDWLLSSISGPLEKTYCIQPNHFCVNMPLNCDDENLAFIVASGEPPPPTSIPTSIAYMYPRSTMAEISREMTDMQPGDENALLSITAKWLAFIEELPLFYRLDEESQRLSQPLYVARPYLAVQGSTLNCGAHFRILQLHRERILKRNISDKQAYLNSRKICITSGRACIAAAKGVPGAWTMGAFVHHVFVAGIVLCVDFHAHSNDTEAQGATDDPRPPTREEIQSICDLLLHMQAESTAVKKLLAPLLSILKRHRRAKTADTNAAAPPLVQPSPAHDFSPASIDADAALLDLVDFNIPSFDDSSWDYLFQDLNGTMVSY